MSKKEFYFILRDSYFWFLKLLFFCILTKKSKNKKLLIIRSDNIGDFIIFSPALKHIKSIYPDYKIYFLGNKILYEIASWFPEIDQFIPIDIKKFQFNPFYYLRIFYYLRKKFFNVVLCPVYSRSFIVDELVRITNAKEKIGFNGNSNNIDTARKIKDNQFFTHLISSASKIIPEVERNKIFVEFLGKKIRNNLIPTIEVKNEWIQKAQKILKLNDWNHKNCVVINLGAGAKYRIWSIEKFIKIIEFLIEQGFTIVFTGSKNEKYLFNSIYKYFNKGELINLIGKTSFEELAGILKNAIFYFGTECGALHLASAVGCPTICLLGGGHFGRFFPYGDFKKNRIIYDKNMKCKNDNWACAKSNPNKSAPCIEKITVEDAKKEINNLLKEIKL